ncbi:hypothetical protein GOZ96_12250 [Agrobacterium vitis]|uniref:Uncharacterized protein n=1 Tax=Agrobacterium vitis TaxID=373 RepID=A0A368NSU7_AGRVI|nr:hypothetical protein [Agrobacterium vitis]KAA3516982.1 hypothetical protein DXM22_11045 [Agrobacterium vitis]KAA3529747.1 hypothetical protein DXT89_08570 [Agrobacterium vitis]MUZ97373.1 hypothetical protein [Agrobacterium vitis]NOJ36249.1 hypothetical protein [Agrobacterium vitis]RCU52301.1 hypothetical protein ASB66_019405 [Agrobacterium vitis]
MSDTIRYEYPKKSVSRRRSIFRRRTEKDVTQLLEIVLPRLAQQKVDREKIKGLARSISREIEQVVTDREDNFFAASREQPFSDAELVSKIVATL